MLALSTIIPFLFVCFLLCRHVRTGSFFQFTPLDLSCTHIFLVCNVDIQSLDSGKLKRLQLSMLSVAYCLRCRCKGRLQGLRYAWLLPHLQTLNWSKMVTQGDHWLVC